ncbi:hypothetical protein [Mucilaginibacter endophyticus]|uniref:hypothetical protein n=1 Tax=Mucilaginibacter endophyticus TaxID=2675003 RepID=UPI00137A0EFA|nr:hypothetical protein [Mucilaginibacter endophyticus]
MSLWHGHQWVMLVLMVSAFFVLVPPDARLSMVEASPVVVVVLEVSMLDDASRLV